jgi:uncharacterized membrane protein
MADLVNSPGAIAWLVAAVWIVAGLTWLVLTVREHRARVARLADEARLARVMHARLTERLAHYEPHWGPL